MEASHLLYKKGIELSPNDPHLLAIFAHFLSNLGDKSQETSDLALNYFQQAMKLNPNNCQYALWYAKLLKRLGINLLFNVV